MPNLQVLVVVPVAREVEVVDPDLVSRLNPESITNTGEDFGNLHIANDDVALLEDTETNAVQG